MDPGSKGLPRVFCTTQTLFTTPFCTSTRGLWRPWSETLLHPLVTTFGKFPFSGPLPGPWGRKSLILLHDAGRIPRENSKCNLCGADGILTVPEGHKHRVRTPEKPRKIPRTPTEPRRAPQNPRSDPRRPLQSPLGGKFPRRASRRVVPLRW